MPPTRGAAVGAARHPAAAIAAAAVDANAGAARGASVAGIFLEPSAGASAASAARARRPPPRRAAIAVSASREWRASAESSVGSVVRSSASTPWRSSGARRSAAAPRSGASSSAARSHASRRTEASAICSRTLTSKTACESRPESAGARSRIHAGHGSARSVAAETTGTVVVDGGGYCRLRLAAGAAVGFDGDTMRGGVRLPSNRRAATADARRRRRAVADRAAAPQLLEVVERAEADELARHVGVPRHHREKLQRLRLRRVRVGLDWEQVDEVARERRLDAEVGGLVEPRLDFGAQGAHRTQANFFERVRELFDEALEGGQLCAGHEFRGDSRVTGGQLCAGKVCRGNSGLGRRQLRSQFAGDGDVGLTLRLGGGGGPPAAHPGNLRCLAAASGAQRRLVARSCIGEARHRRPRGKFRRANAAGRRRVGRGSCVSCAGPIWRRHWPAAQVCAAGTAAAKIEACASSARRRHRLCSPRGAADVLATDYREEPLALLRQSAERGAFARTAQFDILDAVRPLPAADVLVAADLLYLRSTSEALGRRCAEALRAGCASIIVGDCGRPGRAAFLAALVAAGVREESARFEAVDGWSAGTARHELISTSDAAPTAKGVGLLRLTPGDLIE